jgi:hypothetical protein
VKASYTKGCIHGMNTVEKKKTYGKRLVQCREMSIKHKQEIKTLLK